MRTRQLGLTMIELLVTLAVLAVLSGIAVPVVTHQLEKSKANSTRSEMGNLGKALRAYASDVGFDPNDVVAGRFPPEVPGPGRYRTILGADLEINQTGSGWNAALHKGWNGPYVSPERIHCDPSGDGSETDVAAYLVDGWGRYYIYLNRNPQGRRVRSSDSERVITLVSGGPDRDPRTTADNTTLVVYRGSVH